MTTPIHIIPLGGLGEIGMNLMVYEYAEAMVVVDCGITFPNHETPGVDVIIPDITFLEEHRNQILGFVITHGHEDHIGALPYIWPRLGGPIYGTPMTIGMIEAKFREEELLDEASLYWVNPRETIQLGPFSIQFLPVTHSIVDSSALAITTPLGTVIHTGDFKIDHTPVDGRSSDLYSLATYGERGVLALLSDSTNVLVEGSSRSETTVRPVLDEILALAEGLVVVATFSSNIHRIQQVVEAANAAGRKVIFNGRSMLGNVQVAKQLGLLKLPAGCVVELAAINQFSRKNLVIISTGSQGEPDSSLVRIARGEHREIVIHANDTVVFSSRFIPGNEQAIWNLINLLYRRGAKVIHDKNAKVHVSGHACQEDLKLMLTLTRPRFFMPIHGEPRHLHRHRELGLEMGIPRERTIVVENGAMVRLDGVRITQVKEVTHGRVLVDGKGIGDVGDVVLRDRQHLAEDGIVAVILVVEKGSGKLLQPPELLTRGVVHVDENLELLEQAKAAVVAALTLGPKGMDFGPDDVVGHQELAVRAVRRFFKKQLGRRPVVLPQLIEM